MAQSVNGDLSLMDFAKNRKPQGGVLTGLYRAAVAIDQRLAKTQAQSGPDH
jgi:hypothetical protein